MSFITAIRLVADCTAAECSAIESFVLLLCLELCSGPWSNDSDSGFLLLAPWPGCQREYPTGFGHGPHSAASRIVHAMYCNTLCRYRDNSAGVKCLWRIPSIALGPGEEFVGHTNVALT